MDYLNDFYNNIKYLYSTVNPATLSGAIDVIVVEQPDGTLKSTPFYVRFGKYGVFSFDDKYVDVTINMKEINLKMKLGENGVALFENGSEPPINKFNLHYGQNEARFSITTRYQGTALCCCSIYLFKWNEKLVISDIDGTITKSDVLGHVIPAIGGTWAQAGVAELYSRIEQNGYRMVYLSSRAIGQSHYTKSYLRSIIQGSKRLPDGPLLLSPTSVLMALRKEVIERRPDEFKIECLTELKSLFPTEQPFFAGFGNRETDIKSYLAVDIPSKRILIINAQGLVKRADKSGYTSDYATMAMDTVDYLFPPSEWSLKNDSSPSVQSCSSSFVPAEEQLKDYETNRKLLSESRKEFAKELKRKSKDAKYKLTNA